MATILALSNTAPLNSAIICSTTITITSNILSRVKLFALGARIDWPVACCTCLGGGRDPGFHCGGTCHCLGTDQKGNTDLPLLPSSSTWDCACLRKRHPATLAYIKYLLPSRERCCIVCFDVATQQRLYTLQYIYIYIYIYISILPYAILANLKSY
jgi:hypothetical protein